MSERDQTDQTKPEDLKDLPVQPDLATVPLASPAGADVGLQPELQAFIGRQLLATFDEVLNEPIPDRILELLRQLETDQPGQSQAGQPPAEER